MKNFVFLASDGPYPIQVGSGFTVPDGALEVEGFAMGYLDRILVDGEWETRPQLTSPTISDTGVVRVENVPAGTVATIVDTETYVVLATVTEVSGLLEFQLVDHARYEITLKPPLPWMPWIGEITC